MKTMLMALLTTVLLPLGAAAQEATPEPASALSQRSRADVMAEFSDARRNGGLKVFKAGYIESAEVRSRADVIAELRRARATGEYAALNAEAVDLAGATGRVRAAAPQLAQAPR